MQYKRNEKESKKQCEFVKKPFEGCYCLKVSSSSIDTILKFCGGDFLSCPIYRQKTQEKKPASSK